MSTEQLELPTDLRRQLADWARARYPREACGLLLGRAEGARIAVALALEARNLAADARAGFALDPADHLAAERRAARLGLAVVGAWHSHPDQPARPSEHDRAAALSGWCQVIVPVTAAGPEEPCAWRPGGGAWRALELIPGG